MSRVFSTLCACIVAIVGWTGLPALDAQEGRGGTPELTPPAINPLMNGDELSRALDGYLSRLAATDEFAGVVLVAKNGEKLFERAYGPADRDRKTPMTPELRFNIASIGKAFTRAAIGQLIAARKLSLTDTIASRIPDHPNVEGPAATIEQLLNHTAGIVDFFGPRFDAAPKDGFRSNADYYKFIASEPPLFAPGSRKQYCNGCYIVLGEIIARVSGVPYERYITEQIFKPAGMTGAGFLSEADPQVAPGYTRQRSSDGVLRRNTAMHGRHGNGAGGSYARTADLLAFDNALRERRLLDATMTGWYFGSTPVTAGRVPSAAGIAGGAPGANSMLNGDGTWTIVVLGNLDPPNATRVASAIRRQLQQ
jgi:CubicO group peptidase (beta-lactamase class C family)